MLRKINVGKGFLRDTKRPQFSAIGNRGGPAMGDGRETRGEVRTPSPDMKSEGSKNSTKTGCPLRRVKSINLG